MLKKEDKKRFAAKWGGKWHAKKGGGKMICCSAKGCIKMPLGKCTGGAVIDLFLFHFPFFCTHTLYVSYILHTIIYTRYTQYIHLLWKNSSIPFGGASRCHVTLAIDIFLFRLSQKISFAHAAETAKPKKSLLYVTAVAFGEYTLH